MKFRAIMGSFAVLMVFYLGAAFYLRHTYSPSRMSVEANSIIWGLRDYNIARGGYPVLSSSDVPLSEVRRQLIKDGFLTDDMLQTALDDSARFMSNGQTAGLLFPVHRNETNRAPESCTIQLGFTFWPTGWWGNPRHCSYYDF